MPPRLVLGGPIQSPKGISSFRSPSAESSTKDLPQIRCSDSCMDVASIQESEGLALSEDLKEVVAEAEDIAHAAGQPPGSVHLLLAFFTTRNPAEKFLRERGINEDRLLQLLEPRLMESKHAVRTIMERAAQIAVSCSSHTVDGLHVLVGITRVQDSAAYVLLQRTGEKLQRLRTRALTILTGSNQRWQFTGHGVDMAPRHHLSRLPVPREDSGGGRARAVSWSPPLLPPKPPSSRRDPPPTRRKDQRNPIKPKSSSNSATPSPAKTPEPRAPSTTPISASDSSKDSGLLPLEEFPWLSSLGRNLSEEALRGELDLLSGREAEVQQLIDILGKRRANNPCLIGEPGVGKTSIVEGLATRWSNGSAAERQRALIALDTGQLLVGTQLRGSFSEKIRGLQDEVARANERVVIFFDEIHTLMGIGATGDGAHDAVSELKAALARGAFPCIGATTPAEFHRHIAKDPALARRFVPVLVQEPGARQAESMIYQLLPTYAEYHGIGYTTESVRASVRLSTRFIPDRQLPDKAIALLDLAGSRAARSGQTEVTETLIALLVEERTGIPSERLLVNDRQRLLQLESELANKVVGHDRCLKKIAEVVRRHAAGFNSQRPQGSFLLVGPTGVGKTETAKALAEILHGDAQQLVRFDLSEYSEPHSVSRLVGAPPGYVGHESGGQLTSVIRSRPSCVILFDEIEKAHRDVLQLLLQILDDGRITDSQGRTVTFEETIIFLTSNLGSDSTEASRPIGFVAGESDDSPGENSALDAARRALPVELWGRIDEKLFYGPLKGSALRRIARLMVTESSTRLQQERGISFELDSGALDMLSSEDTIDPGLGARPLRSILSHLIEAPIAARILEGRLHAGDKVRISFSVGKGLVFRVGAEQGTLSQRPSRPSEK
ncbi:MAG: ATP-dependent Clp protease ATP-binding subunit [Myxococcales bacterium]|nr:ATP-dependent Clp protease ATP-binding subunit [Myxococcales bacterium]